MEHSHSSTGLDSNVAHSPGGDVEEAHIGGHHMVQQRTHQSRLHRRAVACKVGHQHPHNGGGVPASKHSLHQLLYPSVTSTWKNQYYYMEVITL